MRTNKNGTREKVTTFNAVAAQVERYHRLADQFDCSYSAILRRALNIAEPVLEAAAKHAAVGVKRVEQARPQAERR